MMWNPDKSEIRFIQTLHENIIQYNENNFNATYLNCLYCNRYYTNCEANLLGKTTHNYSYCNDDDTDDDDDDDDDNDDDDDDDDDVGNRSGSLGETWSVQK